MCYKYMIKAAVLSALLTSAAQAQTYTIRKSVDGSAPLIESLESGGGSTNTAPTSNAGTDQTVDSAASVTLDGTGSSDPDVGDTLTYAWTQDSGTNVTLSDASVSQPTFTAPTLGSSDPAATLVFSLVVTDSAAASSTADTVSITVDPPAADCPTIGDICSDGSIYAGLNSGAGAPMYTTPADAASTYSWDDAVSYCANLNAHGSTGWILPSYDDAGVLYTNRDAIGGFNMGTADNFYADSSYWTSTEDEFGGALYFMFQYGEGWGTHKGSLNPIRCVRS
jgi:hypothetical protein